MRKYIFVLFFFVSSGLITAQTETFTPEKEAFFKEVSDFFISADKKLGTKFIEEEFTLYWNSAMDVKTRESIYELSNGLLKQRFRAYPEFHYFLKTLMNLDDDTADRDAYIEAMEALVKQKKKADLEAFNECLGQYFETNTIFMKTTVEWKVRAASLDIEGEKDPILIFKDADLICFAKRDSAIIHKTAGRYDVLSQKWEGMGGKVDWTRAGMNASTTYAVLAAYDLSTKSSDFKVDSVSFYNEFFDTPLLGSLTEKVLANQDEENASYPLFESYLKRLIIKDISPGMDYDGGFTMKGSRLLGTGSLEEPARLVICRDNRPFIVTNSLAYTIRPDRIASDNAKVTIYLSEDSITHPSVQLRFISDERLLTLVRTDEGISKSPFFNSFHELDMYFEAMYWKLDDPIITMGNLFGSSNTKAAFESKDYYKEQRYYALQGIDPLNPLVRVRDFTKSMGDGFYVKDYARFTRYPEADAQKQLLVLANQGFLSYDSETEYVEVRPKLNDYVMNRSGKRDYDILLFNSDIPAGANATLSLINYDLILKGVSRIALSDSQRVTIYPDGKELTVKKNRDFLFNGVTVAGNVEIFGSNCSFDYSEFKVDISTIDSVRLNVEEFTASGTSKKRLVQVKNVLEGGRGEVNIDNAQNKSGIKQEDFPGYPEFTSLDESFVYYDNSRIQRGAYDRKEFYFKAQPYKIDSLDNFIANNIRLKGTLISAIFPNIDKPLTVQKDYSLGFEVTTPASGLAAYKGKNTFNEKISLNDNGLQGNGTIHYLSATAIGEAFVFLPDSTIGETTSFVNKEQNSGLIVPQVSASRTNMSFIPDQDIMKIATIGEPISCFNGQSNMQGEFRLKPTGMEGKGDMGIADANIKSGRFTYTDHDIYADTSDFSLSGVGDEFAFKTQDVSAHMDLQARKGEFKSNGEASFVEFPANQYVCYMDKFIWFMDQNDLALEYDGQVSNDFVIDTDLDLTKSNFFSTREDQDSLNFMAPHAVYDLDESVVYCNDIEHIRVADAQIMPDSGKVVIRKKAKMDELENAIVSANSVTAYHLIKEASVVIKSSKDYTAKGNYTYVDENQAEQRIRFEDIRVDSAYQTVASGTIAESADFTLSPAFQYIGEVSLSANIKELLFKGQTRIFHGCDLDKNWMSFETRIDPMSVLIPVDSALKDELGLPVGIGLMMDTQEIELYSTFLSAIHFDDDRMLMTSKGVLTFDKNTREYVVGSVDKLRERNLNGNLVALGIDDCQVRGEGNMSLGMELGQVGINPVGKYLNKTTDRSFAMDVVLPLNFHFSDDAMKKMSNDLLTFPHLKPMIMQNSLYAMALKEKLGLAEADKVISELTLAGTMKKLPSALAATIVLSDVKLKWDSGTASYISEGPIGLASVGKESVFAEVKGILQLERKRGGDTMTLYLELAEDTWYFFNYTRTLMQAYSSNPEFNDIVMNTKEEERKSKGVKDQDPYTYILSSKRKKEIFLEDIGFK